MGTRGSLDQLHSRLFNIYPAPFQNDPNLLVWLSPEVLGLLLKFGTEVVPREIQYGVGRPLDCHRNALEYASSNEYASLHAGCTANPVSVAYFGLSVFQGVWWVHSWVVCADGLLIDSEPPTTPAHYFGIPWGLELYQAIRKKTDCTVPELPPILATKRFHIKELTP